MKTLNERAEEAQAKIVPILKELMVDIAPQPYIDQEGATKARLIYIDTTPPEAPKPTDEVVLDTLPANEETK